MSRVLRALLAGAVLLACAMGLGIGAAIWAGGSSAPKTGTQVTMPVRQTPAARPHSRSYLFAIDAHAGTLTPAAGKGIYDLVLTGVHAKALYFSDRPDREVGTIDPQLLLQAVFDPDLGGPNAAINALDPAVGHQKTMGVTLLSGRYADQRLTLRVRALPESRTAAPEHGLTDVVLPRSFSHTSLFIDNVGDGHTCQGQIWGFLNGTVPVNSFTKKDQDSWALSPVDGIRYASGPASVWESDGGTFRGCSNIVTWAGKLDDGTRLVVSTVMTDPWSGGNSVSCVVSDPTRFRCGLYNDMTISVGGDNMNVAFVLCAKDESLGWGHGSSSRPRGAVCSDLSNITWLTP